MGQKGTKCVVPFINVFVDIVNFIFSFFSPSFFNSKWHILWAAIFKAMIGENWNKLSLKGKRKNSTLWNKSITRREKYKKKEENFIYRKRKSYLFIKKEICWEKPTFHFIFILTLALRNYDCYLMPFSKWNRITNLVTFNYCSTEKKLTDWEKKWKWVGGRKMVKEIIRKLTVNDKVRCLISLLSFSDQPNFRKFFSYF